MSRSETCTCCDGAGELEVNGKWEDCPECDGSGTIKSFVKLPFRHFPTYKDGGRK